MKNSNKTIEILTSFPMAGKSLCDQYVTTGAEKQNANLRVGGTKLPSFLRIFRLLGKHNLADQIIERETTFLFLYLTSLLLESFQDGTAQ